MKLMAEIDLVKVPAWDFEWLRHGFSTRQGGESRVYGGDAFNLGWTKEDDPAAVAANRKSFVQGIHQTSSESHQASPESHRASPKSRDVRLVTIRQIHSGTVQTIRSSDGALRGSLETSEGKAVLEGDGLVTNLPGVLIAVGTADCVPVLVADVAKRVVGAFHAGWRGTAAKITEQGIALMREVYGSRPEDIVAAVGPGIGACCYVVGDEVRAAFDSQFPYADLLFRETLDSTASRPQYFVDLWQANRRQLIDVGIPPERITVIGECTACTRTPQGERRYFSHRDERGVTGRMLNAIGIASQ
jgi:polyphenol oxidase